MIEGCLLLSDHKGRKIVYFRHRGLFAKVRAKSKGYQKRCKSGLAKLFSWLYELCELSIAKNINPMVLHPRKHLVYEMQGCFFFFLINTRGFPLQWGVFLRKVYFVWTWYNDFSNTFTLWSIETKGIYWLLWFWPYKQHVTPGVQMCYEHLEAIWNVQI